MITCVSFIRIDKFSSQKSLEEETNEENVDELYTQLDNTLVYLDNYKSELKNNLGFFSSSVDNLLKESPVNKMKLVSDSPASINQTFFETLDYKKALIDATKIQDFEDIYLYKMNQLIN